MTFHELPGPIQLEDEVLASWRSNDVFAKSLARTAGKPTFVFYEGPPTANGMPHNGHVLTRVVKDLLPRYKTMRGFHVPRKAGWDTHGLPVEIEVEKELGVRGGGAFRNAREAVLDYGLDRFSKKCVESVFKYTSEWEQLTERIGFWVDVKDAYVTYHRSYVESVWWALSRLFDKGLLYQGHKVVWWWPEGGTALSAHEVGEGYRDVDDPSVTVRFPVDAAALSARVGAALTGPCAFLAWTTTPWTLPSHVALAVGPEIDYAITQVTRGDDVEIVITAAALAPDGETLATVPGSALLGLNYEAPYPAIGDRRDDGKFYLVVAGEHVTTAQGTGIVHTAPGYGEADFEIGLAQGLGLLQLVGSDGHVIEHAHTVVRSLPTNIAGMHFKAADKPLIDDLKARGLMFHHGTTRHSYPFSPRSKDDPLLQLARPGWFIRTTAFKDQLLDANQQVRWLPEHIKEGRFGDFLRNNVDWALSRERFWGTPLPIWSCASCGDTQCYPSLNALKDAGATGFATDVDEHLAVHRPWVDAVVVPCKSCGADTQRVPEVIDCWFDSGCMPFAQHGFPHQGVDAFKQSFPADFISEAVDQTRGWFYSLLIIATMIFDDETCAELGLTDVARPRPYKSCVVLGHVCDMTGKKESKSSGNYTSPDLVLLGRMRMRVQADLKLQPGQVAMVSAAVRSIDLNAGERLTISVAEDSADGRLAELVVGGPYGKETLGLHPDDHAALGNAEWVWVRAPFQPPGADAFRWLFFAANPPWTNTRLSLRAIRDGQREFHLRLANVFQFFTIYANIAGFDPATTPPIPEGSRSVLDQWVLGASRVMVREVTAQLDQFGIYEAARAITSFVDGLSNWYVRRSRERFWGSGDDTMAALWTLYEVLGVVSKTIAPFVPFMADAMHQRLKLPEASVHLCDWPVVPSPTADETALQSSMALLRELANLGLSARNRVGVKVRQPLRAVEVILADAAAAAQLAPFAALLQDELNVREVRFSQDAERFVTFKVKANFKSLGAKLGKEMKLCASALGAANPAAVRAAVLSAGYVVTLPSGDVTLTEDDVVVEVTPKPNFEAAGSANAVVVLHADLDDDLRQEGQAREIVSRIQSERKSLNLDYTDRIHVVVHATGDALIAGQRFAEAIARDVLAEAPLGSFSVHAAEQAIEGDGFTFTVTPA